jgi:hypothetical protein
MKRVVILLAVAASVGTPREKPNPQVAALKGKTVFVKGNNEAAEKIRSLIREDKKACFVLALKEADANATLAVNDQSAIETGGLNTRNDRVTGTLTVKTGELVWSATDHFSDAPLMSGVKTAAKLLYGRMQRAADCR